MIALPWPPAALSPNARVHWGQRARAAQKARNDAAMLTRAARIAVPASGPIDVVLLARPTGRYRYDRDNLLARCKALLDGIADGLGVDDVRFRVCLDIGEPMQPATIFASVLAPGAVAEIPINGRIS